jgi:mRNA interferase RelE/StbE
MNVQWRHTAEKDVQRLDRLVRERVVIAIEEYAETGKGDIRRLQGVTPPLFRLRVGDVRVLFRAPGDDTLVIERVLPRDKAYR